KLKEGPVLGDGGYLLELEKRGWVRAGPFTPEVALTNPEALRQLHIEFREAGAEVLQALTFYASRDKLATVGLQDRLDDLKSAAEAAKALVDAGADIIGMNCLRPPEHMLGPLEEMRKAVPHAFVAAQPVAYRTPADKPDFTSLPQFPFELDPLQLSRLEMAAYAQR